MDIPKELKTNRPHIADSTIKTYASILSSLHRKIFGSDKIEMKNFDETKKILEFLKDKPASSRKTTLSALYVLTSKDDYRTQMTEGITHYNHELTKQEPTETQKEAWLSKDDIETTFNKAQTLANDAYKKKSGLKPSDLQDIQNFIILALLSGVYIPPRRSKDYVDFKIKNVDKEKDNTFEFKGTMPSAMSFVSYKTSRSYGCQKVELPKVLATILKKWLAVNPTDFLLFDSSMNKLTNVKLNQRLVKLFGKKSSVNALRHSYLTDKYEAYSKIEKEMQKDATEMGTSKAMITGAYVKQDMPK